jgi:hypothetical protein
MQKKLILLFVFNLSLNSLSATEKTPQTLIETIRDLIKVSKPSRMIGLPGHEKAIEFIEQKIKTIDKQSSSRLIRQDFIPNISMAQKLYQSDLEQFQKQGSPNLILLEKNKRFTSHMIQYLDKMKDQKGTNLIWMKPGTSKKWMMVTTHLDTISHDKETLMIKQNEATPGADYNGSGVSIALALIDEFKDLKNEVGLMVVFFDYSTLGFLGAHHFLEQNGKSLFNVEDVKLNIHLTMLGYDSKGLDEEKKTGNMKAYLSSAKTPKGKVEMNFFNQLVKNQTHPSSFYFESLDNDFNQSDHVRFWEKGIPSIVLSQNWEKDFNHRNYQTPNDLPEFLNSQTLYDEMRWIIQGLKPLLLHP